MFLKTGINIGLVLMFFGVILKVWKKEKINFLKEEKFILLILILTPLFSLLSPRGFDSFKIVFQKNYRYLGIFFIPLFLFKCKKDSLIYYVTLVVIVVLVAFCLRGLIENNWQEFWKSSMFCTSIGVYLGIKKAILLSKKEKLNRK